MIDNGSGTSARRLAIAGRSVPLPRTKAARIAVGSGLVVGGILGFLPILGFWMVPLGLLVLSQDIPAVRRWNRRMMVRWARWRRSRA